jgi:hypothetical protein
MTLVVRTIMFFNPIKFFFPVTIIILAFGLTKFIYDWRILRDVKESDIMIITVGFVVGAIGVLADLIVKEHKHQYWELEKEVNDNKDS